MKIRILANLYLSLWAGHLLKDFSDNTGGNINKQDFLVLYYEMC